ncbi:YdcF family protein [Nocardia yunnanensis]|uniref:YdcF family protein n=1 Tax=Nocardia yunnanensis TaxID=2382165 RepID=A0A386ZK04_9NOCA|nr:YdcF family protein [Nocardia yunnanensis]AYF76925.1 YdcF family protein [Nocardia yunnanensis]
MRVWRVAVTAAAAAVLAALAGFVAYTLGRARRAPDAGADVVVVLGCKLRHGTVAPMLTRRLDRALEVYRGERERGGAPLLVVSGGQGGGGPVAEADAMADYLLAHGVPEQAIVREKNSRNTEENLRCTTAELRRRGLDPDTLQMTVVTSDFHVLRTAGLARTLEVRAEVTGARTTRLLLRKSFAREFAALLATPALSLLRRADPPPCR